MKCRAGTTIESKKPIKLTKQRQDSGSSKNQKYDQVKRNELGGGGGIKIKGGRKESFGNRLIIHFC